MWKELIDRLGKGCKFLDPTNLDAIRQAEGKLSIIFPADLRDLLLEANGIGGPGGNGLIAQIDLHRAMEVTGARLRTTSVQARRPAVVTEQLLKPVGRAAVACNAWFAIACAHG
jgi:hypothetical protein